jgi:hypothetical protein
MNLHFITSVSKNYWYSTGQHCIGTWNLPGKTSVYVDQKDGDLDWLKDIPFHKELLNVPPLEYGEDERAKVRKFWGKSVAQLDAVQNRGVDERVIWLDADVEQISEASADMFTFDFQQPLAMMNSQDHEDCWESGLVIFNQQNDKLNQAMKKYDRAWNDEDILSSLWRPYDAQVLGYIALDRGYLNLCQQPCSNINALDNTRYANVFKHWINKDNKKILAENKTK